jgi:predicted MPP superfamily phosphohydrolase
MESETKTPFLPYFLSHYLFLIVCVLVVVIALVASSSHTAGPYRSAIRDHPFSAEPFYFVQLSDLHISHAFPTRVDHVRAALTAIVERISPELTIFTGDMVDGTSTTQLFEVRQQFVENWLEYNKTITNSRISSETSKLIMIPGNHDLYNVESYESPNNFYPRFRVDPLVDFHVEAIDYESGNVSLRFLSFNPVRFPFITVPLGVMPYVLPEYLDQLEAAIADDRINVILAHYPLSSLWSSRSIVDSFGKADVILCGHTHPVHAQVRHYGDLLSVVTSPIGYGDFGGLVTIDEGAFVYHEFEPAAEKWIAVTFPVPLAQVSPSQIFNENSFPVRVLSFSAQPLELSLAVDKSSLGRIPFVRQIHSHVRLYSLDVELPDGVHTLAISGDAACEFEFFIGSESPSYSESGLDFSSDLAIGFAAWLGILCLLKVIPWWIPLKSKLDDFSNLLHFGNVVIPWFHQLYLGPLYLWARLRKASLSVHIVCCLAIFWPLVIPFYITKIESTVAAVWCWGYFAQGTHFKFQVPILLLALYFGIVLLPLCCISGTLYEGDQLRMAQKVEMGLFGIPIVIAVILYFVMLAAAGRAFSVFTSPGLYLLLAIIGFVLGKSIFDFRHRSSAVKSEAEPPPEP